MTNLEDIDELLIDFYVEVINAFIGGEPAIEVCNYDVGEKTIEFLDRLTNAILDRRESECLRKCPFRKVNLRNEHRR